MTPRKYLQNSRLVQWAFLFEEYRPLNTSTCAIFWRSVVVTPFKLLLPVLFVCLYGYAAITGFTHAWFPDWHHASWFAEVNHQHRIDPPFPWGWTFITVLVLLIVCAIGEVIGLWRYIHALCKPVEIEGGLVRRSSCPGERCTGMIVLDTDTLRCNKCKGVFTPTEQS